VSCPVVSNVTVSFLCTPGSAPIVFCPAPQLVSTEGALQLITGTAMDANGLTADTRQFIGLDKTKPALSVTSPADGSLFTTATIAVTGTASDALSGVDTVTCNGFFASLSGGNFSCNISLNPGVNLLVVRATDRASNVSASISHVTLDVPLPAPVSLKITPGGATLLVGDTQQFTAVDENDHRRTDATWTVSDTTIATITTASSPVLTAIAVGQVTLTANVGSASAQVQINALSGSLLPSGTVRWVAPSFPGFAVDSVIQAEPVDGAPDLYSLEVDRDNYQVIIRALTADGQQLWVASVESGGGSGTPPWTWKIMADGRGGVLAIKKQAVIEPSNLGSVIDFDGQTGWVLWQFSGNDYVSDPGFAVGPDATIYFTQVRQQDRELAVYPESLLAMDPLTGGTAVIYDAPYGTASSNCGSGQNIPMLSKPVVGPDGSTLVLQSLTDSTATWAACGRGLPDTVNYDRKLSLVQIAPNGGSAVTSVQESNSSTDPFIVPDLLIPDDQGGAFASWHDSQAHLSHNGADSVVPIIADEMVLGDNGVGYAIGTETGVHDLMAFDQSGSPLWTYPIPSSDDMHLVRATAADPAGATAGNPSGSTPGGGVIVNDMQQGLIPFDSGGNPGTPSGTPLFSATTGFNPDSVSPFALGDYTGPLGGTLAMFSGPTAGFPASGYPSLGGNPGHQNQSKHKVKLTVLRVSEAEVPSTYIQDKLNTAIAYWQLTAGILIDWDSTIGDTPACLTTANDPPGWSCDPTNFSTDVNNITDPSAATEPELIRRFNPSPAKGLKVLYVDSILFFGTGTTGGITLSSISNTNGIHNFVILRNNTTELLVPAHEMGHAFGLPHAANPFNLMCLVCSSPAALLTDDQIATARKTAAKLAE